MDHFGDILRNLREKKGLSVNQLGMYSGVSPALISKIENRKRGTPKPETIEKLAIGLKMPYEELLKLAGIMPESIHENVHEEEEQLSIDDLDPVYRELIEEFEKLSEEDQHYILGLIKRIRR